MTTFCDKKDIDGLEGLKLKDHEIDFKNYFVIQKLLWENR